MRKLLMGAVVASVSLAVAAGAHRPDARGRPSPPRSRRRTPARRGSRRTRRWASTSRSTSPDTTVEFIDLEPAEGPQDLGQGPQALLGRHARRRGPGRLPVRLEGRPDRRRRPPALGTGPDAEPAALRRDAVRARHATRSCFYVASEGGSRHRRAVADHRRDHRQGPQAAHPHPAGAAPAGPRRRRVAHRASNQTLQGQGRQELPRLEHRLQEPQAQVHRQARRSRQRADDAAGARPGRRSRPTRPARSSVGS